ncbi:MAG: ABC transporter ATP-binding protein [Lutibacter sp.]
MSNIILKVENLSKQYRLGLVGTGTMGDDLKRWWANIRGKEDPFLKIGDINNRATKGTSDYVWALKDINFEVQQGEVLGIIGKNGAGKSTLLKILSKITSPTTGSIKSKGRVASLLEVGTGFHGEMTGRENIYLNGAILGMTKKEITAKLEEIIEFSGCERYIDTPVKRYSSGMTVRLAFAVAAFLEPDILIIDEVLAVGDAEFQKKAIGKMQEISKGQGRTVLFVSHNMAAVKQLCTRGILLENGRITREGNVEEIIVYYLNLEADTVVYHESDLYVLEEVIILNSKYEVLNNISNGEEFYININLIIKQKNPDIGFCIAIYNDMNELITAINTYHINTEISKLTPSKYSFSFKIEKYIFNTGLYFINFHINDSAGNLFNLLESVAKFNIYDDGIRRGDKYRGAWPGKISLVPKVEINEII